MNEKDYMCHYPPGSSQIVREKQSQREDTLVEGVHQPWGQRHGAGQEQGMSEKALRSMHILTVVAKEYVFAILSSKIVFISAILCSGPCHRQE
jgi:hypothetical protein